MLTHKALRVDGAHATSRVLQISAFAACRTRYTVQRESINPKGTSISVAEGSDPSALPLPPDLPATYKRLVARACGASFRDVAKVQEVELRAPGPGEVLIRVTHAGINGGCETFRARGEYAFASNRGLQDFPLGAEGAGIVAALGPGTGAAGSPGGLTVGQRVAVNGSAAFAEYVTARASLVVPVPEGVSGAEATALVLSGVTACAALEATARVRPGEVVAVTAAAGGTGHLAVQLAAAAGATVVAVVGGPAKAAAVAALGAHHVVDYSAEDVVAAVRRLCPGGVDVVYEGVGGRLREQMLACLAPEGRLLQVGYISEYPHTRGLSAQDAGRGAAESAKAAAAAAADSSREAQPAAACTASAATAPAAAGTALGGSASAEEDSPADGQMPSTAELFWGGLNVQRGKQRVIGQIWPKDIKSIARCRRRVFDLASRGQLKALTDQGHGRKGVEGIADAVDYMLRGGHVGKVVIEL